MTICEDDFLAKYAINNSKLWSDLFHKGIKEIVHIVAIKPILAAYMDSSEV